MAESNLLVLAREFKKLRDEVKKVLSLPIGPQGEKGDKGDKGDPGEAGRDGIDGKDGLPGRDGFPGVAGKDGIDGQDGVDGKDGISVVDARVDFDGHLVLVLSNGTELDAGAVTSEQMADIYATLKQGAMSLNELLPTQTGNSGKYLTTDGTNASWNTVSYSDLTGTVPTWNQNTTGTAANVTGTVAIGNGGTGQTTKTAAYNALSPNTTKGDIEVFNGTNNVRLPVGTNNYVLTADSTAAEGVKWAVGSTTYPSSGIAVSTGSAWGTSLTAPSGAIVGTTDTQSLSNKTLTGTKETVFAITDAAAFEINPANGGIQTITLGSNRTPKGTNFLAGQSVTLMVTAGAFSITWTDTTFGASGVKWVGASSPGSAPTLSSTAISIIELWEVGTQVYGAFVGVA